ncbi:acyl-CoA carboxylase subunit epsilon [Nonomuraea sp. NPDC050310]|uniref:acyl-CoA carboxylase subunit epsilon n=1 Tax=unclassified Nonomuraea TaxID=2593643 RepID=UPI0034012270
MKLSIVRGEATPEEIAALVAVLTTRNDQTPAPAPRKTESWRNPARSMRKALTPGKSAWRNSGLP